MPSHPQRGRAALALAIALFAPSAALAQAATVDQVLAAVASVVRDRAKQVASRTIADDLVKSLCDGKITLPPYQAPSAEGRVAPATRTPSLSVAATSTAAPPAPGQPSAADPLVLHLGGKKECRDSYLSATPEPGPTGGLLPRCDADDVFLRTCRAAQRLDVPLTDPYFLKSLSRDTIDFLMRVAARNLSARMYVESGLVEVGAFIHAILEQLTHRKPDPRELADPTLALADRLSSGLASRTFADLEATGVPARLVRELHDGVVKPWVDAGCPPYLAAKKAKEAARGAKPGELPAKCELAWYEADCAAEDAGSASRDRVFGTIFGKLGDPGPLFEGRDRVCGEAFRDDRAALRTQCRQARLTSNLYGNLVRAGCVDGRSAGEVRATFRELTYVVSEQAVYRDALGEVSTGSVATLDELLDAVQMLNLSDLPREELAAGVRLVGTYAAAVDLAPEATAAWLKLLSEDLQAVRPLDQEWHAKLLHGRALGTDTAIASPPVATLRGVAKDLLTIPALAIARSPQASDARRKMTAAVDRARDSMRRLLEVVRRDPAASGAFGAYVGAIAAFVSDLGDLAAAMGAAVDAAGLAAPSALNALRDARQKASPSATAALSPTDRKAVFERAAMAMKQGGIALQLAAERDWVGLAIRVDDEVTRVAGAGGKIPELERSLRFVRVLLTMYQAPSVDEAKAIFAANLEDVASRERRYPGRTVDVAALVGFTGGVQYTRVEEADVKTTTHGGLAGLFVPFGVQVASGPVGLLAYPLDLGAYLTSTAGDGDSGPDWRDAFRAGLTGYYRPWASVPVVFGVGGDYRFQFEGTDEWRWYANASLELPLFTIH